MKAIRFFLAIFACVFCSGALLSSCSSMDEPDTGIPIKMTVSLSDGTMSAENLSKDNPVKVIGYARDKKCSAYYKQFETTAYVNSDGQMKWLRSTPYWPGVYMKFVIYWPATAVVSLDSEGNVIGGDCELLGISEPVCHESKDVSVQLFPYGSPVSQFTNNRMSRFSDITF